jgi:hypothetical protein
LGRVVVVVGEQPMCCTGAVDVLITPWSSAIDGAVGVEVELESVWVKSAGEGEAMW